MAKFQHGHKFSVGRRQNGQGNPSNEKKEQKRLAAALATKYLEEHYLKPALDLYGQMASGKGPRGGKLRRGVQIDAATNRDFVGKFLPPAPRKIDLGTGDAMEDFVGKLFGGEFDDPEDEAELVEAAQIEDKTKKEE